MMWGFLLWPFLCCLVLTGIHAYLGLHVVRRGVIFVDLSLGQITALGATVALLLGYDIHGRAAYFYSLGFTLMGAMLFAWSRTRSSRVPQEALIGITYAVASALAILLLDRSPEGAEHIKYILVGNLLAVGPKDVMKMAVLYTVVGTLHWFWRRAFSAISEDPDRAAREGLRVRLWDFLFYASFGVVVTSSVEVAGVLLVFSFLVTPAVIAVLFSRGTGSRLAVGWGAGALASLIGIYASYRLDAPTGASVICAFGGLLAVSIAAAKLIRVCRGSPRAPAPGA